MLAFLASAPEQLSSLDVQAIRAIGDFVDQLIQKQVILLTELPEALQQ